MKLKDYELGYADATKEYLITPEIFDKAFFDPKNIESKLLNDWNYILVGRKGVGKSAFNSRIQSISKSDNMIVAIPLELEDFQYTTFSKASSDKDIEGTKRYYEAWNFLILCHIYKIVYKELGVTEVERFTDIIKFLDKIGFKIESLKNKGEINKTVEIISKLKGGFNSGIIKVEFEKLFGYQPKSFLEIVSTIVETMLEALSEIFLHNKIFVLIDGVDDILRIKKSQIDILSSLIRSVEKLNKNFYSEKINIKILVFLREDILNKASDPDLNKIKRDGVIHLSWGNDNTEDLKQIVELRLNMSKIDNTITWEDIFKNKRSWEYMIKHTLHKPRDVLQFLVTCKSLYPNNESLNEKEIKIALKSYAKDYFIEEMKNELSGFIDDEVISLVPALFQRIGREPFKVDELQMILEEQTTKLKSDSLTITKQLLLVLFEAGYIGQAIKTNRNPRPSIIFKYRNTGANIDYSLKFLIHQGIIKGLGINA